MFVMAPKASVEVFHGHFKTVTITALCLHANFPSLVRSNSFDKDIPSVHFFFQQTSAIGQSENKPSADYSNQTTEIRRVDTTATLEYRNHVYPPAKQLDTFTKYQTQVLDLHKTRFFLGANDECSLSKSPGLLTCFRGFGDSRLSHFTSIISKALLTRRTKRDFDGRQLAFLRPGIRVMGRPALDQVPRGFQIGRKEKDCYRVEEREEGDSI